MGIRQVADQHAICDAVSQSEAVRIREALEDILQSSPFRHTKQCQGLLRYVLEHTLAGESDLLRERVIGTGVFGRTADYDTGEDPVVRVRVADVRKRLAQYYQGTDDCPVEIEIPSGSYRAVFHWKPEPPVPSNGAEPNAGEPHGVAPPVEEPRQRTWRWLGLTAAALGLAVACGVLLTGSLQSPDTSALDQFWSPALASPKPILIYNATSTVFQSPDFTDGNSGLVPVRGQYTCIGDAYASVMLGSLFSKKGKLFQMRYGTDLSFGDLRYQPSILIGAFNNAWTLQTTNELRFVFDKHPMIRDRSTNRRYTLPNLAPDGRTSEDYAIVSRVFDSRTGELLIAAAGITQYGTRAAGEFLTSPRLMAGLVASAPRGWQRKNVQVLLHTKIVDETSGLPMIVTSYFW